MRGCFVLIVGIVFGAVILAAAEAFLMAPPAAPAPPASSFDVRMEFQDAFLTRQLQSQAGRSSTASRLQGLSVQSDRGNEVVVSGTAVAGRALKVPAQIIVRPTVDQNRVVLQVVRSNLGSLPLPAILFRPLEDSLNQQIRDAMGSTAYRVVGVSTTSGGVQVDLAINR